MHRRPSALRLILSAGLAFALLAFAAPSAHAAATLAKNLQGKYKIKSATGSVNGHSGALMTLLPPPTITLGPTGFSKFTSAQVIKFLDAAGANQKGTKGVGYKATLTGFIASGKGTSTINENNVKIVISLTSAGLKGSVNASGITIIGSAKGTGKVKGKSESFTLGFTIKLVKS
jgi:hypothetical protein